MKDLSDEKPCGSKWIFSEGQWAGESETKNEGDRESESLWWERNYA